MSRLVCEKHGKRAMVLEREAVVHRDSGEHCATKTLRINGHVYSPTEVRASFLLNSGRDHRGNLALKGAPKPDDATLWAVSMNRAGDLDESWESDDKD